MNQVDIFSYHQSATQGPSSASTKPNSSASDTKSISHFTPIAQKIPPVPLPQPPQHKPSLVPHLHVDQRIRQRSLSRERDAASSQKTQAKETKKVVAFGRTTKVENKDANTPGPSTRTRHASLISTSEAARIRTDIENLRNRVNSTEKMQKDVDQLNRTLKKLATKGEQDLASISQQIRTEIGELRTEFDVLNRSNSELIKRLADLEVQLKNISVSAPTPDKPLPPLRSPTAVQSYQQQQPQPQARKKKQPTTPLSEQRKDILYSCLPASTNRQIRQIDKEFRTRRNVFNPPATSPVDRTAQKQRPNESANRLDYTANNDTSRRPKQQQQANMTNEEAANTKENRPKKQGPQKSMTTSNKKALASNQVIELNDTYDKDDFSFNEE